MTRDIALIYAALFWALVITHAIYRHYKRHPGRDDSGGYDGGTSSGEGYDGNGYHAADDCSDTSGGDCGDAGGGDCGGGGGSD